MNAELPNQCDDQMSKNILLLMPEHLAQEVAPVLSTLLPGFPISSVSSEEPTDIFSQKVSSADFIIWSIIPLTREVISLAPKLRLIQKWGSGIDGIDLLATTELGIPVANVPGSNAVAVAEQFFALLLGLYKRLFEANLALRSGEWSQARLIRHGLYELSGKTLGIIGLGNIGCAIVSRALAFEMRVNYFKRSPLTLEEEIKLGVSYLDLPTLVRTADVIGLALPLNAASKNLINEKMLEFLKPTSILINISRGPIVDEAALYKALLTKKIAGAGLDVFQIEPALPDNPLFKLENVLVSPHLAGRTKEAMLRITEGCAINIAKVFNGQQASNLILMDK
jgi:phosphoglycerate dehydrogenase-like enzyme